MRKYELTEETKTLADGTVLHRIRALMDIPRYGVRAGDIGGWIEKYDNLSQDGDAFVFDNAKVRGNAYVFDNAKVCGDAEVYGTAWVYCNAKVYGNSKVYGDACVCGNAEVYGNANVCGDAWVCGNAEVCGNKEYNMSNEKQETIADIVEQMRIGDLCAVDTTARSMYINDFLDSYADRIEAAYKRELAVKDAEIERLTNIISEGDMT